MTPRVLYIITRLDRGGSAEAVSQWAEGMKQRGYDTAILTGRTVNPHIDMEDYTRSTGIPIILIESLVRELKPVSEIKALLSICRVIREYSPQIVHTNSSKGGIIGRIAAKLCNVPVIVHSPHGHIFYGYYGKFKTSVFVALEKLTACFTGKITTLTKLGLEDHVKLKIAPRQKFRVVYAGIDVEKFQRGSRPPDELKKELNIPPERFVAGWVGRLDEIKNPMMFAKVAKVLADKKNIQFLFVGEGDQTDVVENFVAESGLKESVIFAGFRQDIADLLQIMDVYCLTSNNEGLGRSILEAQAAGIPVIATDVGGVPEIIQDGITGILVPPGDHERFAQAIESLIIDQDIGKRLIGNASGRIHEFSLIKTLQNIDNLYRELLPLKFIPSL